MRFKSSPIAQSAPYRNLLLRNSSESIESLCNVDFRMLFHSLIRALRRVVILATAVLAIVLLVIVYLVTQPELFNTSPTTANATANTLDTELPNRLEKHVRKLVFDFAPREHSHFVQLNNASAYIHAELSKHAPSVAFQNFHANSIAYRNVVAQFGPDTEDIIVIGAHYDSYDVLPAADDNASGVAGLIELAQLLSKATLNKRVELVAYTLEEPPYFRTGAF